jgi:hypothetical protein
MADYIPSKPINQLPQATSLEEGDLILFYNERTNEARLGDRELLIGPI